MSPATRGPYFKPRVALALKVVGWLLIAALIFWAGVSWARDRHAARTARMAECEARLEAIVARNPLIAKGHLRRVDACANLAALVGDR